MSTSYHGVIVMSPVVGTFDTFMRLNSPIPLRLMRVTDRVVGIYSFALARSQLVNEEYFAIAHRFSQVNGEAIIYFYCSAGGLAFQILRKGRVTSRRDLQEWDQSEVLTTANASRDEIENALCGGTEVLAETIPSLSESIHQLGRFPEQQCLDLHPLVPGGALIGSMPIKYTGRRV